jgi:hypothetical protein
VKALAEETLENGRPASDVGVFGVSGIEIDNPVEARCLRLTWVGQTPCKTARHSGATAVAMGTQFPAGTPGVSALPGAARGHARPRGSPPTRQTRVSKACRTYPGVLRWADQ